MITLTTDFGDSHYVGAMKGSILSVHPDARIVDVTHAVPRYDARACAFSLAAAAPFFPEGTVHVAVVDPGVGTARRPIVAECLRGVLVGPDTGVLMPAARKLGLVRVREITNTKLWRAEVSSTFHGRDVFGPVAAHLDQGLSPEEVGPVAKNPVHLDFGHGRAEEGRLEGELVYVDHFGNCITNIPGPVARLLLQEGGEASVEWAGGKVGARLRHAYREAQPGEPLLIIDSAGYLEVAVAEGSFAELSGMEPGMAVRVVPAP